MHSTHTHTAKWIGAQEFENNLNRFVYNVIKDQKFDKHWLNCANSNGHKQTHEYICLANVLLWWNFEMIDWQHFHRMECTYNFAITCCHKTNKTYFNFMVWWTISMQTGTSIALRKVFDTITLFQTSCLCRVTVSFKLERNFLIDSCFERRLYWKTASHILAPWHRKMRRFAFYEDTNQFNYHHWW